MYALKGPSVSCRILSRLHQLFPTCLSSMTNITQTSVRVSLFSFLVHSADFLINSKIAGEPKFETKEGTDVSVLPLISYQVSFTDVLIVQY